MEHDEYKDLHGSDRQNVIPYIHKRPLYRIGVDSYMQS
jgi:hypothetical protein